MSQNENNRHVRYICGKCHVCGGQPMQYETEYVLPAEFGART